MVRRKVTTAKRTPLRASGDGYDPSFEVLLFLARAAKAGYDVNAMLLTTVEAHFDELVRMPEFQVAMGAIPRPADVAVPWLLTVDESDVTPLSVKEKE